MQLFVSLSTSRYFSFAGERNVTEVTEKCPTRDEAAEKCPTRDEAADKIAVYRVKSSFSSLF